MYAAHVLMCVVRAVFALDVEDANYQHESYKGDAIHSFDYFATLFGRCTEDLLAIVHDSHGAIFPVNVPRKHLGKKNKHHKLLKQAKCDTVPADGMHFRLPPSEATRALLRNKVAVISYKVRACCVIVSLHVGAICLCVQCCLPRSAAVCAVCSSCRAPFVRMRCLCMPFALCCCLFQCMFLWATAVGAFCAGVICFYFFLHAMYLFYVYDMYCKCDAVTNERNALQDNAGEEKSDVYICMSYEGFSFDFYCLETHTRESKKIYNHENVLFSPTNTIAIYPMT